jgi:hypothetical protein
MVTWVVQSNLLNDSSLNDIIQSLQGLNIAYQTVEVIPFSDEFVSPLNVNDLNIIPYGSTSLLKNAYRRKWTGAYFNPDTFCYKACIKNRDDMLNSDGTIMTITEAGNFMKSFEPESRWFIRPIKDLKEFCGQCTSALEIERWMTSVDKGSFDVSPNCEIIIASPKQIFMEWRHIIVNRKIVTSASYRVNRQLLTNRELDPSVIGEAQKLVDKWLPHDNCVMDTAYTSEGLKVIEFNNINSSGFYNHDVLKFVEELTKYGESHG